MSRDQRKYKEVDRQRRHAEKTLAVDAVAAAERLAALSELTEREEPSESAAEAPSFLSPAALAQLEEADGA